MKLAIATIAFGSSRLIKKQYELLTRFCKDDFDYVVVDNSVVDNVIGELSIIKGGYKNFHLHRVNSPTGDYSKSHAYALNWTYDLYKDVYDYFLFLDHDCFPTQKFSVIEILQGKVFGGLKQVRYIKDENQNNVPINYMWAGFFMFNNNKIGRNMIDFSTNKQFHLDTGGNLYPLFHVYPQGYFESSETKHPNPQFEGEEYAMLHNEMFIHFQKASNWNGAPNHESRLESLYGILEDKIK